MRDSGLCTIADDSALVNFSITKVQIPWHSFSLQKTEMLGKRKNDAPINVLTAALSNEDAYVRAQAASALGKLRERTALEPLMSMIDDTDGLVRSVALRALRNIDQQTPIGLFIAALGDGDERVREVAASILQQDHPDILLNLLPEAMAALEGRGPGDTFASLKQSFVAEVFGYLNTASPAALESLDQLLNWPYWEVRMKVCEAMGKLRRSIPNTAIQRLLELRHDPQSRSVREVADDALAEILTLEAGIEDDEI